MRSLQHSVDFGWEVLSFFFANLSLSIALSLFYFNIKFFYSQRIEEVCIWSHRRTLRRFLQTINNTPKLIFLNCINCNVLCILQYISLSYNNFVSVIVCLLLLKDMKNNFIKFCYSSFKLVINFIYLVFFFCIFFFAIFSTIIRIFIS